MRRALADLRLLIRVEMLMAGWMATSSWSGRSVVIGGVAKSLTTSDGQVFDLQPVQRARIQKDRRNRKKWQRRAARRKNGSKNRQKAQQKAARYQRYEKHVHHDFAHQASHRLVAHDAVALVVFEDLHIPNMTKRPKANRDAAGRFIRNGAKA